LPGFTPHARVVVFSIALRLYDS